MPAEVQWIIGEILVEIYGCDIGGEDSSAEKEGETSAMGDLSACINIEGILDRRATCLYASPGAMLCTSFSIAGTRPVFPASDLAKA